MAALKIDRLQGFAVSATPPRGPESSLGSMPVRNGLLVRIVTQDGVEGWGEAWCNFPPRGNLARLALLQDVIAPAIMGQSFESYSAARPMLEAKFARLARHTGEQGPFAHCFSAIDTALADIAARQSGMPLSRFLTDTPQPDVAVYASTPNVGQFAASLEDIINAGHKAVKLKIGFALDDDIHLMRQFETLSGGRLDVMVDANQNWSLEDAKAAFKALSEFDIGFIEEPLAADAPMADWQSLAASSSIPVAAGENILSAESFRQYTHTGGLKILQPDVAKWGGVSGAMTVGNGARNAGVTCAMHYMGTALGLAASVHTLAAIGGTGPVEIDANPNPLRTDLGDIDLEVRAGRLAVPEGHGIGFVPDPQALKSLAVAEIDIH